MKKTPSKKKPAAKAPKKDKGSAVETSAVADRDPEWDHHEERYSSLGSEMRALAKLVNGDSRLPGESEPNGADEA